MRSLGQRHRVALKHQVCHKLVYGCISYNSEESADIPQRHITKSGQEPIFVAQFLTLCRASNLAEARRLSSPFESPSHEKRRASTMPPRAHVLQREVSQRARVASFANRPNLL